ncbi:MAG: N4-gp56 family major capsid protein [Phenylobacterium sp.]|nr:N4-gp56 family major capsid protein [Phenylobacterium sp.]
MAVNSASAFSTDIENFIADETLPLARRQLVAYQFGDPLTLDKGRGTTYTATRYNRLPLPFAPLSEGVPPIGETMTISQVSATAQQWGDKVTITDVAEMTIKHPLFKKATELTALQMSETLERNTMNALMAGTQVNYVNSRGSRGALVAGDVLDTTTVIRTDAALETLGAPRYMGDEMTDTKIEANAGGARASENPRAMPHYVALIHTLVVGDFRSNATVVNAWTYSDLNRLYNYEAGEWSGIRFCKTNMIPSFTGVAQVNGTAGTAGNLATNATYYIIVTASDTQNQYESRIYQVSASISVTGPNGSISVTLPNIVGFTFNVYVGTTSSPTTLGLSASGPTSGPMAGQAVQLTANTTVVITGIGSAQTPPAAPATGLTVYPTFILGRGAYGQVVLDNAKFSYLKDADKSDPLNQLRVIGWKLMYGTLLENQSFFARIEAVSAMTSTFG